MLVKAVASFMAIGVASAHMELDWPYPLRSKFDPNTPENLIDYSMTSPLDADGSNFPCKGYNTNTPWRATVAWSAGQQYNISLAGSATHGGGSCQLSLSYDNGTSFHVIESIEGGCPLQSKYDFTMPDDVANGDALFAWTWFNFEGNREMYMNCVDITISGGSGTAGAFESAYPAIFVANVNNGCSTVEQQEVVFANPGKQVLYGGSVTSSSSPFPSCS
ncbi:putative endoglucanase [Talaromyces proteolyticus]|uniref:Endoglucanase n=1 Tax=Talaromyces proteolyticus TaxID=1131652 RepID=A0AAD4L4B2_9EURO|nr:putative endoglucanase [Talaromyces proteolyticus]KAH8703317.1 putative endoglucanase [Talaromyces proteolyticus]